MVGMPCNPVNMRQKKDFVLLKQLLGSNTNK